MKEDKKVWNDDTKRGSERNWVSLDTPENNYRFDGTELITWDLKSVDNPEWTETRDANKNWDFDVTDSDVWTLYEYWVNKFQFVTHELITGGNHYTSRSYGNLNSAYFGFDYVSRNLFVNRYDPQNKTKRIIVYAGTQTSDIKIRTTGDDATMGARKLELIPETNARTPDVGGLVYTSRIHDFDFYQAELDISFRVAAGIELSKGLYYVEWKLREED